MADKKTINQSIIPNNENEDETNPSDVENSLNEKKQQAKEKRRKELKDLGKKAGKKMGSKLGGAVAGPAGAIVGRLIGPTLGKKMGKKAAKQIEKTENKFERKFRSNEDDDDDDEINQAGILNLRKATDLRQLVGSMGSAGGKSGLDATSAVKKQVKKRLIWFLIVSLPTILWLFLWGLVIGVILFLLVSAYKCYQEKNLIGKGVALVNIFRGDLYKALYGGCSIDIPAIQNSDKPVTQENPVSTAPEITGADSDVESATTQQ